MAEPQRGRKVASLGGHVKAAAAAAAAGHPSKKHGEGEEPAAAPSRGAGV